MGSTSTGFTPGVTEIIRPPLRARQAPTRARRFQQGSFGRRRSDEYRPPNSTTDCLLPLRANRAPKQRDSLPLNHQTFGRMFGDLAAKNHAALVPYLLEGVIGNPSLNLADGIHPNAAGQKILAENVWRVLEPVAREVAAR